VEAIERAIMSCLPVRALAAKTRDYLAGVSATRLKNICVVVIMGMLVWDAVLMFQAVSSSGTIPRYTLIHPARTVGSQGRQPDENGFLRFLDSVETDRAARKKIDSLLMARPGLVDSVRWLEQMASGGK